MVWGGISPSMGIGALFFCTFPLTDSKHQMHHNKVGGTFVFEDHPDYSEKALDPTWWGPEH